MDGHRIPTAYIVPSDDQIKFKMLKECGINEVTLLTEYDNGSVLFLDERGRLLGWDLWNGFPVWFGDDVKSGLEAFNGDMLVSRVILKGGELGSWVD